MSTSPEPPERLAEILMEILALSKPDQASESECVKEQLERADEEDNNRHRP